MGAQELHIMTAQLLADRQTMRYTCPVCQRCLEDGPNGLNVLHRGDQTVRHQSGTVVPNVQRVEPAEQTPPPTLH